jgi:hypothetical protein
MLFDLHIIILHSLNVNPFLFFSSQICHFDKEFYMKSKIILFAIILFTVSLNLFGQATFPRTSPKSTVSQTVGDTEVSIVYHRPNVKGRTIWGCQTTDLIPKGGVNYDCLVPNGQVWRTGANEATTFEISNDVTINGQKLPKGKYSLHTIPNANEWTIIFNKTWNQWGSFRYDEKEDALRVTAKPVAGGMNETMSIGVEDVAENTAKIVIRWEKISVPFTVDIGDVNKRAVSKAQRQIVNDQINTANFILSSKMTDQYANAIDMLDKSLSTAETYAALTLKARILAEMGKKDEAIKVGERAVEVGKKATPPANTSGFEQTLAQWKSGK